MAAARAPRQRSRRTATPARRALTRAPRPRAPAADCVDASERAPRRRAHPRHVRHARGSTRVAATGSTVASPVRTTTRRTRREASVGRTRPGRGRLARVNVVTPTRRGRCGDVSSRRAHPRHTRQRAPAAQPSAPPLRNAAAHHAADLRSEPSAPRTARRITAATLASDPPRATHRARPHRTPAHAGLLPDHRGQMAHASASTGLHHEHPVPTSPLTPQRRPAPTLAPRRDLSGRWLSLNSPHADQVRRAPDFAAVGGDRPAGAAEPPPQNQPLRSARHPAQAAAPAHPARRRRADPAVPTAGATPTGHPTSARPAHAHHEEQSRESSEERRRGQNTTTPRTTPLRGDDRPSPPPVPSPPPPSPPLPPQQTPPASPPTASVSASASAAPYIRSAASMAYPSVAMATPQSRPHVGPRPQTPQQPIVAPGKPGYQQHAAALLAQDVLPFADVVIRVAGSTFPCHRAVLALHSPRLRAMLYRDTPNLPSPALSMSQAHRDSQNTLATPQPGESETGQEIVASTTDASDLYTIDNDMALITALDDDIDEYVGEGSSFDAFTNLSEDEGRCSAQTDELGDAALGPRHIVDLRVPSLETGLRSTTTLTSDATHDRRKRTGLESYDAPADAERTGRHEPLQLGAGASHSQFSSNPSQGSYGAKTDSNSTDVRSGRDEADTTDTGTERLRAGWQIVHDYLYEVSTFVDPLGPAAAAALHVCDAWAFEDLGVVLRDAIISQLSPANCVLVWRTLVGPSSASLPAANEADMGANRDSLSRTSRSAERASGVTPRRVPSATGSRSRGGGGGLGSRSHSRQTAEALMRGADASGAGTIGRVGVVTQVLTKCVEIMRERFTEVEGWGFLDVKSFARLLKLNDLNVDDSEDAVFWAVASWIEAQEMRGRGSDLIRESTATSDLGPHSHIVTSSAVVLTQLPPSQPQASSPQARPELHSDEAPLDRFSVDDPGVHRSTIPALSIDGGASTGAGTSSSDHTHQQYQQNASGPVSGSSSRAPSSLRRMYSSLCPQEDVECLIKLVRFPIITRDAAAHIVSTPLVSRYPVIQKYAAQAARAPRKHVTVETSPLFRPRRVGALTFADRVSSFSRVTQLLQTSRRYFAGCMWHLAVGKRNGWVELYLGVEAVEEARAPSSAVATAAVAEAVARVESSVADTTHETTSPSTETMGTGHGATRSTPGPGSEFAPQNLDVSLDFTLYVAQMAGSSPPTEMPPMERREVKNARFTRSGQLIGFPRLLPLASVQHYARNDTLCVGASIRRHGWDIRVDGIDDHADNSDEAVVV